ncbi:hypothetical protein B0H17DRAFT_1145889 [Mycena rosella]|uniref:Uncharacterized protein n=1 Tax=Mycena rosella TaxID=1033263 RepID=A0AAD7CQ22_MYCRO|nr:hypothetical protein B0H17DRAFT_1145889 [Mycena rosella]
MLDGNNSSVKMLSTRGAVNGVHATDLLGLVEGCESFKRKVIEAHLEVRHQLVSDQPMLVNFPRPPPHPQIGKVFGQSKQWSSAAAEGHHWQPPPSPKARETYMHISKYFLGYDNENEAAYPEKGDRELGTCEVECPRCLKFIKHVYNKGLAPMFSHWNVGRRNFPSRAEQPVEAESARDDRRLRIFEHQRTGSSDHSPLGF